MRTHNEMLKTEGELINRIVELETALREITWRHCDGSVHVSYDEGFNLLKVAPVLDIIHPQKPSR